MEKIRNRRYEIMLRKINKSNASSLVQESLYESRLQSSTLKNNNGTLHTHSFYPRESNPSSTNFETVEQIRLPSGSQTSGSNVGGRVNQSNFGMSIRYKNNTSQCIQQPYLQGLNPNHNEFGAVEILNAPAPTSESNYAVSEATLFKQPLPPRRVSENARYKQRIDVMLRSCQEDKVSYDFFTLVKL